MYRWSAIKGEDGQSLVDFVQQFYYSDSNTEPTGGTWFESSPEWQEYKYLWKRYKATYKNPDEIKYTVPIYDPTWNHLNEKLSEIQIKVDSAKNISQEAVEKANEASKLSQEAKEQATKADAKSDEAKNLANLANTSTSKVQERIDVLNTDIKDSKKQIQDAVEKANANATEINTVKETYATKIDLTNESKTIHADVSTEIEKKIGELSTSISENYSAKSELTELEGVLNTKIKQNADTITTQASSIEKLQADTTQAQKDLTDALDKASKAQTSADDAQALANQAKSKADDAMQAIDVANSNLSTAQKGLDEAKENLKTVTGRVDATEKEIADAQSKVSDAQTKVAKAQEDVIAAQSAADTAIKNAKTAQGAANEANAKAEQAQKDLVELTNKVTSNTTKIEQNAKQITLQATKTTEASNKVDGVKEDLANNYYSKTQTDAQIKVATDRIKLSVSETYITKNEGKDITSTANSALTNSTQAKKDAESALTKAQDIVDKVNSGELDGEDAVMLYIDSSNGTTFKNSDVATIFTVTVYVGGIAITDSAKLKEVFGQGAYLQWLIKRYGETEFTKIPLDDSRLNDNGFMFTLNAKDIKFKAVFNCELNI